MSLSYLQRVSSMLCTYLPTSSSSSPSSSKHHVCGSDPFWKDNELGKTILLGFLSKFCFPCLYLVIFIQTKRAPLWWFKLQMKFSAPWSHSALCRVHHGLIMQLSFPDSVFLVRPCSMVGVHAGLESYRMCLILHRTSSKWCLSQDISASRGYTNPSGIWLWCRF